MALSTISGTTGITDSTITSAKLADFSAAVDLNGVELILDADADTSISADTDDQIDIKISGADDFTFTANAFNVLTGSHATFADSANAKFGTGSDMLLYHDGTNSYITNSQGALKIATETSGIAVTIGHTTSEVTVADNLTVTGTLTLGSNAELTEAEFELLDGLTAGTAIASKVVTTDANIDSTGMRNLTISGELDAATLDISGNADIDGTLEADAYTVDGTALNEYIADTVGAMVTSNTESGITVAYQDGDNTLDFTVGTLNQDTTGTAAVATVATTVTITDNESTDENNVIVFVAGADSDGGNVGLESDGHLTYNPSSGTLTTTNLVTSGTHTVTDSVTMTASNAVVFEGSTADAYETTLTTIDTTGSDKTISLPNVSGTLPVLAAVSATAITATPAEINLIDGGTARGTTAVASGDGILINDGGTMNMTNVDTVSTYFSSHSVGGGNIVTTGALNSGSITSGFGTIDTGSSTITTTGDITGGTFAATTDTAAGDNASIGYTSGEGLILTGQGSTSDITLKNDADATVFTVPTGTDDILFPDAAKAMFGASSDLSIYHDGSHSYIEENGTGDLIIKGTSLKLRSTGNEDFVVCTADGSVAIRHNDAVKLETTSAGATVTGVLTATLQANAIDSDHYVDGSIDTAHIADNQITADKLSHSMGDCSTMGFTYLGLDGGDHIHFDNNATMRFTVNGNEEMRLEADGDLHADGDVIAYSTTISDERLKENIQPIEDALSKVRQLNGVTFTYKADGKESAGLIAQDVEKVLPSAVSEKQLPLKQDDGQEYKVLQYDQTIGLLVESIKELTAKVEELQKQ